MDSIIDDFYIKVSSEDVIYYKTLVEKAIELGYTPKKDNKKYGFSITFNNRKVKNSILMLYYGKEGTFWKLKFYANKTYSNNFDDILKQTFEKFKYLYNNGTCIQNKCGRCKKDRKGYNIEYGDGKNYFLCGFYLIPIYTISKSIVDEAAKMMENQHKEFIQE